MNSRELPGQDPTEQTIEAIRQEAFDAANQFILDLNEAEDTSVPSRIKQFVNQQRALKNEQFTSEVATQLLNDLNNGRFENFGLESNTVEWEGVERFLNEAIEEHDLTQELAA